MYLTMYLSKYWYRVNLAGFKFYHLRPALGYGFFDWKTQKVQTHGVIAYMNLFRSLLSFPVTLFNQDWRTNVVSVGDHNSTSKD